MKKVALFALIMIACYGCNKDKGVYTPIDPFIKSMFNWQKGSYWIMDDSLTGQIDSFVVDTFHRDIRNGSYGSTYEFVFIYVFEFDSNSGEFVATWHVDLDPDSRLNEFALELGQTSDSFANLPQVFPAPPGYSDFLFSCNGKAYSHVYYNSSLFYGTPNAYMSLYINQSDGLIKMDIKSFNYRRVWELIVSKIYT
ncbi:MAG: hypothetical protein ABI378_06680 [Chitinophagaceae bacterium]